MLGGDLFKRLVTVRHFSEDVARQFLRPMVAAVAALHADGITHGSVPPLLASPPGVCWLFGCTVPVVVSVE